ncbi:MAG TPA: CAP domain-containing protein [Acidimicrobiales bacterium]|nr:CAP domain-containing protein [Acidimicrobiales bacterium]
MTDPAAGTGRRGALRVRLLVLGILAVALSSAGLLTPVGHNAPGPAVASPAPSLAAVESLYAQDLVARINAERAARNSPYVSIPPLTVDPTLQADAQAWSGYMASVGQVSDPSLSACDGSSPGQMCVFAANSGDTGYGYWPGDGSDGMDGAYMSSPDHRQNELNAAYTAVGVGVTCAGNQAWTVELFGDDYGDMAQANAREVAQDDSQGDPVPESPIVAGAPSGDPVYCPGQTVGPNGAVTGTGGQYPYPFAVAPVPGEPNGTDSSAVVGMASTSDGQGYWLARADGAVSTHGDAVAYGDMSGQPLNAPITHIVATPDGRGYWLVAQDGGIFSFGDARFFGSMGGQHLNAPVVSMAPTPDGGGYWLVAQDGGIFSFGDARFLGSMGDQHLNQPVVGMAVDPATGGYWLVATDGGIFAYGAPFDGSTGALALNQPVNQMAATQSGNGYWLVASDGGVFAFGKAGFYGSAGDLTLAAPVIGMAADPTSGGYWLVGSDGGVFSYDAPFFGAG